VVVGFAPIPLLLSKRIDALGDAITWSEPAMYDLQINKPADDKSTYTFFAFAENGVPRFYTLGVVADEAALQAKPDLYRHFLVGWRKGLDWMIKNQTAAIDGLIKHYPAINRVEALVNLAEIARISESSETKAHGLGWQDVAVWEKQEKFMLANGQISENVDVSKAVTNAYLPPAP
jgi:ABC-type nitrate/sulfonate/bicarbonate transport system substrate-binding protein